MKTITSAGANKLLRSLEDEKAFLLSMEEAAKEYTLAENEECQKPDYNYKDSAKKLQELDNTIRKIKHYINVFNVSTILPNSEITIDEALVKMAQLNRRKETLDNMRKRLPKSRKNDYYNRTNIIEYTYLNYDLEEVKEDYQKISEEITQLQLELDTCNQTKTFEIDL